MRKILTCLCVCLCAATVMASCGNVRTDGNPFGVFERAFRAEISVLCDGNESRIVYTSGDNPSITFEYPEKIRGFSLTKEENAFLLSYGGIKTEIPEKFALLLRICEGVFSASPEDISSMRAENNGIGKVCVVSTADAEYVFADDGSPVSIEGNKDGVAYSLSFSSFGLIS